MKSKIYQRIIERESHSEYTTVQGGHGFVTVNNETEQELIDRITDEINESGDFLIGIQYFTDDYGRVDRAIITMKTVENK